jgi:hypothetical protein
MSRRREPRVETNLDVKVWGLDRYGNAFVQKARTVDATRLGIRLMGVDCVNVGEVVGVQHGGQKANYEVVWTGREYTPKAGQIGLHCLEPDKAVVRLSSGNEGGDSGITPQNSGFDAVKKGSQQSRREMPSSRRKHPRYLCTGGAEIRQQETGTPMWGNMSDVSMTGCYVETISTLPAGNMVLFHLHTHDLDINGRAVIKTSHHAVGMGLAFLHLSPEDQHRLEFLIGTLAGQQEMLPNEKRTFKPADPPVTLLSAPETTSQVDPPAPHDISGQIMRAITVLSELEQHLVKDQVDPRLIAQFHDAMEHTRQTAWTVQQWIDLRTSGGDPFGVLPQLEAERMHMLIKLAHNVVADVDAGGINEFTEGIAELAEASQQLHKRVSKMSGHDPENADRDEFKSFRAQR